jgi:hypothetical protein
MKLTINENGEHLLQEVFTPVVLKTEAGEVLSITMRDSGFEFCYQGEMYFAKEGYVEPFKKSVRGNYLIEQKHEEEAMCADGSGDLN